MCIHSDTYLGRADINHHCRMSVGLGMTRKEWEELKGKVDDSFWVMRIIGEDINSM